MEGEIIMDESIATYKKEDDFPKSIVVILVVLAVAISVLGTFTVLSEISKLNSAPVYTGTRNAAGKVAVTIIDPNKIDQNAGIISATGKVAFTLLNPEGE